MVEEKRGRKVFLPKNMGQEHGKEVTKTKFGPCSWGWGFEKKGLETGRGGGGPEGK